VTALFVVGRGLAWPTLLASVALGDMRYLAADRCLELLSRPECETSIEQAETG
jgi:hypothetical protein